MSNTKVLSSNKRLSLLIVYFYFIVSCSAPTDLSTATPVLQQLRIENTGSQDIALLTVLFPGPTSDAKAIRVEFGDIQAGETTEYRNVPSGVYKYAAYEYMLDGRIVKQFVTDWVGESPMIGEKFIYRIMLDLEKVPGDQIQLLESSVDTP